MAFLHLVGSGVLVYAVDVNGDDAVFHEDVRLVPLSGGLLARRVHVLYDREEGTFLSRALLVLDKVGELTVAALNLYSPSSSSAGNRTCFPDTINVSFVMSLTARGKCLFLK